MRLSSKVKHVESTSELLILVFMKFFNLKIPLDFYFSKSQRVHPIKDSNRTSYVLKLNIICLEDLFEIKISIPEMAETF